MPESEKSVEQRALRLFERGKPRAAIAVLTVGLVRNPNCGGHWLLRAIVRHAQQDWAAALGDVETAMTLIALPVGGQLVLADCYSHTGRTGLALTAYKHLLKQDSAPRKVYAGLYAGFQRCGRPELALQSCRQAVLADPEDHAAYFAMAHGMAALGHSATFSAAAIEKAVRLAPTKAAYRVSLAIQLVRCGRPDDAYQHLAAAPIERLAQLACVCSARRLLELCLWAGDAQRCERLSACLLRLRQKPRGNAPRGADSPR